MLIATFAKRILNHQYCYTSCRHPRQPATNGILARLKAKHPPHKYGYPPDMQKKATETVIQQAELLAEMM